MYSIFAPCDLKIAKPINFHIKSMSLKTSLIGFCKREFVRPAQLLLEAAAQEARYLIPALSTSSRCALDGPYTEDLTF